MIGLIIEEHISALVKILQFRLMEKTISKLSVSQMELNLVKFIKN